MIIIIAYCNDHYAFPTLITFSSDDLKLLKMVNTLIRYIL